MPDPGEEFFERLVRGGYERLVECSSGVDRFDLNDDQETDHWYFTISNGDLHVGREDDEADLQISADHTSFDQVGGAPHPFATFPRTERTPQGNGRLLNLRILAAGALAAPHPRSLRTTEACRGGR